MQIQLTSDHRYVVDGSEFPSVTQILAETGHVDKAAYLKYAGEFYRTRGTYIHLACAFVDSRRLDWTDLDPAYAAYVKGYEHGKHHHPVFADYRAGKRGPLRVEWSLADKSLRYAGTIDRYLPGLPDHQADLIDIKTSKRVASWWRIQLAAYAVLVGGCPRRHVLQLREDGSYRVIRFRDDPRDIDHFLFSLLEFYENKGLTATQYRALAEAVDKTSSAAHRTYAAYRTDKQDQDRVIVGQGHAGTGVRIDAAQPSRSSRRNHGGGKPERIKWTRIGAPSEPEPEERQQPESHALCGREASQGNGSAAQAAGE